MTKHNHASIFAEPVILLIPSLSDPIKPSFVNGCVIGLKHLLSVRYLRQGCRIRHIFSVTDSDPKASPPTSALFLTATAITTQVRIQGRGR